MLNSQFKALLKTKKMPEGRADETEKAQFALANEHFEVEVQQDKQPVAVWASLRNDNSKFLDVPFIKRSLLFSLFAGFFFAPAICYAQFNKNKKQKQVFAVNMPKYDRRRFHFGINIGTQLTGVAVRTIPDLRTLLPDTIYSITPLWNPGFTMGIETNMRINENLDLRFTPQLTLTSRTLLFERPAGRVDKFEVEATFVEFPFYIKFKTNRINNFRAYVLAGGKYVYDISNKVQAENASEYPIKFAAHDAQAEAGFGLDFYLPYFKFSMQVKGSWGFVNLNVPENNKYNNGIEGLYARSVFITFLFE